ncbi:MAG: hypothetical protein HFH89_06105 [Lachnospiraceae bacterium]|nr:hypothetical protein [uncultured Acetatifactor sp.]MCI8287219.1 hypothetical protein [Lachnospiraceae bacterium]
MAARPFPAKAYEKAVSLRRIDAQTGWSMAHMAAVYARLRKGEAAMECLDNLARSSLLNNFFTLHNDWRGMNISLVMDSAPVPMIWDILSLWQGESSCYVIWGAENTRKIISEQSAMITL